MDLIRIFLSACFVTKLKPCSAADKRQEYYGTEGLFLRILRPQVSGFAHASSGTCRRHPDGANRGGHSPAL